MAVLVVGGDVGEGRGAAGDLALLLLEVLAVEISVRGWRIRCSILIVRS
jgi:hypothetical protein